MENLHKKHCYSTFALIFALHSESYFYDELLQLRYSKGFLLVCIFLHVSN